MSSSSSQFLGCEVSAPAIPPVISVRRALMTVAKELSQYYNIIGVVANVVVLSENYKEDIVNEDDNSFHPAKKSKTDLQQRRCQITLQDTKHGDTIALYVPQTAAACNIKGSTVIVSNCMLFVSQGRKKKMYITNGKDTTRKLNIEVIRRFSSESSIVQPVELDPVPFCSIHFLSITSLHNRCQWTIRGHVTFIKKVFVSLRCSKCSRFARKSSNNQLRYYCPNGCYESVIQPLWETSLAFDDGTSEADVNIENDGATLVLRAVSDESGVELQGIVKKINNYVWNHGKFGYDSISVRNDREYAGDAVMDRNGVSNDGLTVLLDDYLRNCSYLRNYEMLCSIDFANGGDGGQTKMKRIYLQENNSSHPHRIQFNSLQSKTSSKLALKAYKISELRKNNLRLSAWDLLMKLEDDVG